MERDGESPVGRKRHYYAGGYTGLARRIWHQRQVEAVICVVMLTIVNGKLTVPVSVRGGMFTLN